MSNSSRGWPLLKRKKTTEKLLLKKKNTTTEENQKKKLKMTITELKRENEIKKRNRQTHPTTRLILFSKLFAQFMFKCFRKKTVKLLPPKWLSIPPSSVASCSFLVKNAQTFKRWHRVGLGHRHRTRTSRDQSVAMSETRYRSPLQFYIANFCRFWHRQRAIPKPNVMQRLTRMEFKAKTSVKLLLIKY